MNESHLSGAYALHALTDEEAARVEAAMGGSEELRGEVAELTDTAVTLGLAVRPVTPPPALRARLLDAIVDLPQEAAPADEPARPSVEPDARLASARHLPARRRRRLTRPGVLLSAALAAVLLFGGGVLAQQVVTTPDREYARITASADARIVSAGTSDGGTATVSWSRQEDRTAVVLNGVEVPEGKVLQLWNVRGSTVTSAGLHEPAGDSHVTLLDGAPAAGAVLAVSVEPAGGSKQPTSAPIVTLALT